MKTPSAHRLFNLRDQEWNEGLRDLCADFVRPDMVGAEIGCYSGESTIIWASSCAKLYAIDPWAESYRADVLLGCADQNISSYVTRAGVPPMSEIESLFDSRTQEDSRVIKIKATDEEALGGFCDASLDFVYIDAIHTFEAVSNSIRRWLPKIAAGGFISGHDFDERVWPGVVNAVSATVGRPERIYRDTSWVILLR